MSDDTSNESEKILESLFDPENAEILVELKDGPKSLSILIEKTAISKEGLDEKLSYLIEKGFTDKDVGEINFIAGTLVLIIYPFVGKLIDKTNKVILLNSFCFLSFSGLSIFYFTESYLSIIIFTAIFYLSIGSIFLINFNIINSNLKNNLIVFGVASYSISENIGSFLGPNIVGGLISYEINYFLFIFIFVFLLIFLIFNFFAKKVNGGLSGT